MQLFKHDSVVFQGKHLDVILSDAVSKRMNSYRQKRTNSKESGGILIGERRGRYWIVTDITTPMKEDIQTSTRFVRQDPEHIEFSRKVKKESKSLRTYMGEWHTHPQVIPYPSSIDLSSWKSINISEGNSLVFLILGTMGSYACYSNDNLINEMNML